MTIPAAFMVVKSFGQGHAIAKMKMAVKSISWQANTDTARERNSPSSPMHISNADSAQQDQSRYFFPDVYTNLTWTLFPLPSRPTSRLVT